MAKKTGLGKGLEALFIQEVTNDNQENEQIQNIKLTEIEPNTNQARKNFDDDSIKELAESIKNYGVIQPIIVCKRENYYEIIAGERRWRASKKAGLKKIPAIIRDNNGQKNKEISLIENIQREDLNPIEKAIGIKQLMEEHGLTQQAVSEKLGKSRSSIANTLRILNLDKRVIKLVLEGKLTEGHCKALLAIEKKEEQYNTALHMIETGFSVREAEKNIKQKKKNITTIKKEAIYKDIESSFQTFFGTKVRLNAGARSGKIIVHYNSNEDLERILELIR